MQTVFLVLCFCSYAFCHDLVVHLSDGSTKVYNLAEVQKLTHDLSGGTTAKEKQKYLPKFTRLIKSIVPNPFNPNTSIAYDVNGKSNVSVAVFNVKGDLVKVLFNGEQNGGEHRIAWNSQDQQGKHVGSGFYIARIRVGNQVEQKQLILIK